MSQQLKKSGAPLLGVAKSIYYLFVTKYKVQRLNCIVENFLKMCCFVIIAAVALLYLAELPPSTLKFFNSNLN